MNIQEAKRVSEIQRGIFAELSRDRTAVEATGRRVIDLSILSPDIAPTLDIRETTSRAYVPAWNYTYPLEDIPPLKEAVCSWYLARYGVDLDPETEIQSLNGSQDALVHMFLCFTDPGDKVLVCNPYYPAVMTGIALAGAEPVFMPLRAENGFLPDLSEIPGSVADEAKIIVVSYPNNPTTATAPDSFWKELIAFAQKHNILIVHDNAYSDITYDGVTEKSFLAFDGAKDVGIELNSLSATYSIGSLRCSFMLGCADAVSVFSRLKSNLDPGIPFPVQYAAIAALTQEQSCVLDMRSLYEERRNIMSSALAEAGLAPVPCMGTPFLWIPLPESMKDDAVFCRELLWRAGVLLTPGSSFGSEGRGYVRAALNLKSSLLKDAATAIKNSGLL